MEVKPVSEMLPSNVLKLATIYWVSRTREMIAHPSSNDTWLLSFSRWGNYSELRSCSGLSSHLNRGLLKPRAVIFSWSLEEAFHINMPSLVPVGSHRPSSPAGPLALSSMPYHPYAPAAEGRCRLGRRRDLCHAACFLCLQQVSLSFPGSKDPM